MSKKFVIDNCSLSGIINYYYFDRDFNNVIHKKIIDFFISKISNGDIIILDKVFLEFQNWGVKTPSKEEFEKKIAPYVINTLTPDFLNDVNHLISDHMIERVALSLSKEQRDTVMQLYRDKYADLYLVAYCNYLKVIKDDPVLITEENFRKDGKLIEKIPTICHSNTITFCNLPHAIFDFYKDELKFKLN